MSLRYLIIMAFMATAAHAQLANLKSPNVSADALFLYRQSDFGKENLSTINRNGPDLQEAELAFYADVDPYSRLNMLMSMSPQYTVNNGKVTQSWSFEPEELYAETDQVPGVTFRIGKFKAAFGKHNILHTHAYPFVDPPMINEQLLGDEGLNDVGASAAAMIPLPWFSELTGQYLRGEGDNFEFSSPSPGQGVGLGRWRNLWDMTESSTLEVGGSVAGGNNAFGGSTTLAGGDLTYKWRPVSGGKYHSGILAVEYIDRELGQSAATSGHGNGFSVWGSFQFAERWAAKLRYETLYLTGTNPNFDPNNPSNLPDGMNTKGCALLEFDASEFSFFRLEYDQQHGPAQPNGLTTDHKIYLQANFTIGSHPAHAY